MKLFITGAAGYIGGSFLTSALRKGYRITCCDNYSNSNEKNINKLKRKFSFDFCKIDLRNYKDLDEVLSYHKPDAVIHFAALKSVPQSEVNKTLYTENNFIGTKNLLEAIKNNGIKKLIFSSSAAVYGEQKRQPVPEDAETMPISHYAKTKVECENLIKKYCEQKWLSAISLRYFNPLGVHQEKIFYECIHNKERNILGNILACHLNVENSFMVYGNDYTTPDGTAIRDYIHIDDLVDGHFAALKALRDENKFDIFNLGSNIGTSVYQLVHEFISVSKKDLPIQIAPRRSADLSISYADSKKSNRILKWKVKKNLKQMCESYLKIYESESKKT